MHQALLKDQAVHSIRHSFRVLSQTEDLSPNTRANLIERIRGGDFANADFVLKAEPGDFHHLENEDLRLDFDFQNLELYLEDRLQNAQALKGHGILLGNSFAMDVTGGRLVDVNLVKGGLSVPDFRDRKTKTHIWLDSTAERWTSPRLSPNCTKHTCSSPGRRPG